jgi:hypothetical protein
MKDDDADERDLEDREDLDGFDDDVLDEEIGYDQSSAILLTPRQPFIDWYKSTFPEDIEAPPIEPTVALIPEFNDESDAREWLRENCSRIFEFELAQWEEDEATWPPDRSWEAFNAWFDVSFAPCVYDCTRLDPPYSSGIECPPVSLMQIVEELENLPHDAVLFLDLETGGLVMLANDQLEAVLRDENDADADRPAAWQAVVASARQAFSENRYLELDNPYLLDDMPLMETFAATVQAPPSIVNRLQDALRGRRAAQRFLDVVDRSALRSRWADFKRDAATEAMRIWLREMGIPTTEDGD